MPVTEQELLEEIVSIIARGPAYASREKARKFFNARQLPRKLASYIKDTRRESVTRVAKSFGMSYSTLNGIIGGVSLSENMLFRLRNALEGSVKGPRLSATPHDDDRYQGDWRNTDTAAVQNAISVVSQRLIFLKRVVETSNSLKANDSPIDKIQIAQLVALLEVTLSALKAPFVEKGQTAGFFNWLWKIGKRGAEKGIEKAVSGAIDGAVNAGSDLLDKLGDVPGVSDLGDIIT